MDIETPTSIIYSLIAGGSLGLFATPHCFGMCGPLHMAICLKNKDSAVRSITQFNLGRIIGYTSIGALLGLLGSLLRTYVTIKVPSIGGIKPGMIIPIMVMLYISISAFRKKGISSTNSGWWSNFFKQKETVLLIPLGFLASLLPCGILYVAFGIAMGTSSLIYGASFMLAFVLTQTFFMEIAAIVGKGIHIRYENVWNKVFPWVTLLLTIFYILMLVKKVV
ncbi:MAG: hypothetical protein A2381_02105 [Bdellovibrionales bacterium RIFOXYB1_FULL_37_110]|nr:MAG: hypothetical protein A2417_13410 [Bdellovibrionales bacterium RIFOXYC1_FULL_37_79]OFZ59233.1 MAG: hypothetical protein A2381_02105 [Bdellovibrionales bacterium RIFOXYB1_FULL_37_110]OFZ62859.1 MAG: hypothetical protein A2577_11060 [Bdellovibrionales bacterium RIFOXYD1_FULL_36_51]